MASTPPPGELFALDTLVTATAQGIASRVLARTAAGFGAQLELVRGMLAP